jgi:hypothetical protein
MPEIEGGRAPVEGRNSVGKWQPGYAPNPEGKNQYTYRRDTELKAAELAAGTLAPEEIDDLPQWVQKIVEPGMTRGQVLAAMCFAGALRGEPLYFREALKRVWPVPDVRKATEEAAPRPAWWERIGDPGEIDPEERRKLIDLAHAKLMESRLHS